jgi:hypothetical protein
MYISLVIIMHYATQRDDVIFGLLVQFKTPPMALSLFSHIFLFEFLIIVYLFNTAAGGVSVSRNFLGGSLKEFEKNDAYPHHPLLTDVNGV